MYVMNIEFYLFISRWRSVLAHHLTSLRDPVFWMINKKIIDMVDDSLKTLPGYTRNELFFPGVRILNIEVKKIMTMFEPFKFEVTDALKSSTSNPMFQVNLVQNRLNHKPFTVKLNITSLTNQKGFIKLYIGPKISPGEFAMKKNLFMLLDNFEVNLKIGGNIISRTSSAFENISEDFTSLNDLRKVIEDAEFGLDVKPLNTIKTQTGFPSRLVLPKGTPEGLPMQLLAFVAPFVKTTATTSVPRSEFNSATLAPGYPFDLDFEDKQFFGLPNVMIKDIIVTHKENKSGSKGGSEGSETWFGGDTSNSYGPTRDPSAGNLKDTESEDVPYSNGVKREVFDYNSKKSQYGKTSGSYGAKREPYDYNLRKNQYGKTEDYSAKRGSYYKDNKDVSTDKTSVTESDKIENKVDININDLEKNNENLDNISVSENKDKDINAGLNVVVVGDLSEVPKTNNYYNRQFLPYLLFDSAYLNKNDYLQPLMYHNDFIYE